MSKRVAALVLGRRDFVKLGLAGTLLAAGGASAFGQSGAKVIGFGQPDRTASHYKALIDGVKGQADTYGYQVRELFSGLNAQKQADELNGWLASGVNAMVVLATDANAMAPIVKKCHEQGVKFISYAVYIDGSDGYLSFDDKQAGAALGEYLAKFIREKHGEDAKVGFMTYATLQITVDRIKSVQEVLKREFPKIQLLEAEGPQAAEALKATQSMLQAHPDLRMVIGCSDDGCLGVRSAFVNAGITGDNIFIAGFDGARQNLEMIKQKDQYIKAAMALDLVGLGRRSVEIAHALLENADAPASQTQIKEPYLLINQETDAAELDRLLAAFN